MYEIDDYTYISSSVANAFYSGLPIETLLSCMLLADNKEQFDAAISAAIELQELVNGKA
jgi:hypothetical protein